MADVENAFVVLGHLLRGTVYALERGRGDTGGLPAPGSFASREYEDQSLTGEWGQAPARDASALARIQCISASDHLLGLADSLESAESGAFVSYTIGRGVLEMAARSWYLAAPGITVRERVRRYMNERLRDIYESRYFLRKLEADVRELDALDGAISRAAEEHGFTVHTPAQARGRKWLDQKPPSTSELCDLVLASAEPANHFGSATYSFLSASAHGTGSGLVMHLDHFDDQTATVAKSSETHARYLLWPVRAYVAMGDRILDYFGWDRTSWEAQVAEMLDVWVNHAANDRG